MNVQRRLREVLVRHQRGDIDGAIGGYREVLAAAPASFDAWRLLGAALLTQSRLPESVGAFDRAVALRAQNAETWALRGDALAAQYEEERARESYRRALALDPVRASTWNSLGLQCSALGLAQEACAAHRRALELAPANARFQFNLGLSRLSLGDYDSGWEGFEARQAIPELATRYPLAGRVWSGDPIGAGQCLLVLCEQGIGDTIQFCRFLTGLAPLGVQLIVQRPPQLRGLIESLPAQLHWLADGAPVPDFDLQCGMLSLARLLRIRVDSIPSAAPYLAAPPVLLEEWLRRLGPSSGRRVGIVCSGNPRHANDARRSMPLEAFLSLRQAGMELHLLQDQLRPDDVATLHAMGVVDHRPALAAGFATTAALASCMDVVVSVDTAVAHLAGALGLPVFVLLPAGADWRWMSGRSDSPWYPSARLVRRRAGESWHSVVEQLAGELVRVLPQARGPGASQK